MNDAHYSLGREGARICARLRAPLEAGLSHTFAGRGASTAKKTSAR